MQKTEIYERLESFCTGGNFPENRSLAMKSIPCGAGSKQWLENQFLKFTGLLVIALLKRGQVGAVDSVGVRHASGSFDNYFNCTFLRVFDL